MASRTGTLERAGAWTVVGISLVLVGLGVTVVVGDGRPPLDTDEATSWAVAVGAGLLGGFVLTRHPGNRVGRLFVATALLRSVAGLATPWAVRAYTLGRPVPLAALAAWTQLWTVPVVVPVAAVLLLLFPDDRMSGRLRLPVVWFAGAGLVLLGVVGPAVTWPLRGYTLAPGTPLTDDPLAHIGWAIWNIGLVSGVIALVLALIGLLLAARRVGGDARQQILWFAYGAGVAVVINLVADLAALPWLRPLGPIALLTGAGLAIFRYRLYDIDRLVNRTLVYGLLTAAALAAYAAVAVVTGQLLGNGSTVVAALAAFVVALALRPGRDALQDLVDRIFDRRTHSAVSVVRALGREVGRENVDPARVTAVLRSALRDPMVQILFHVHGGLVTGDGEPATTASPDTPPWKTEVALRGRPVAVLVHGPVDPDLLRAVTDAAATVLEHARLQAELRVRLGEVRASRNRLVTAADAERRRIERDLHDGAQQRLIGLAVHIQATRRTIPTTPPADALLTRSVEELHRAVEDIRGLVHGILPPALASGGLGPALGELATPGEVRVELDLRSEVGPIAESTAWFVAAEGVTNARKHAPGAVVTVRACTAGDQLVLTVSDTGPGGADPSGAGLRGLADRVEACGGQFTVDSAGDSSAGTTLTARLPA